MKKDERLIAEAVRCEVDEDADKFYIVFEVVDSEYKLKLKKEWTSDIEFRLIKESKKLVL